MTSYEDQGSGYDPGAAGHELQGRAPAPDPRAYWTPRKVLDEPRPVRKLGYGGARTIWACCDACGMQKVVDLAGLVDRGHGEHLISDLKLRCECGQLGHAKMTWVNPPKWKEGKAMPSRPRPGSYDFATGESKGPWD